jgi:NAD(P)-dependent dehydrogenase (short-subunit alcohol dehydrogenase family)
MAQFKGKVAVVTGGTSGIGRSAAVAFAREGAKVVVAGRRQAEGEETVREVRAADGDGFFVATDVTKEDEVRRLVTATVEKYGRLDFLFSNAGLEQTPTPLARQTEEQYRQIMDVNVKGVWLTAKHGIPAMLKNGGGAVVNTSSVAGVIGLAGVPLYIAAKHAVVGLTKALALEFGKQGVRVNAVLPAAIDTAMFNRFTEGQSVPRTQFDALHPIGRIGRPEEVADAVIWLCSDRSSFVTGHSLMVDGGWTAQ